MRRFLTLCSGSMMSCRGVAALVGCLLLLVVPAARADRWSQTAALSATVMANSSPSAHLNTEGNLRIYYAAAASGHQLRQLAWNSGSGWADQVPMTTTEVMAGSSPTSFPWPSGGVRAYYAEQAAGHAIRELNYTTGSPFALNTTSAASSMAPNSSPSAARNSDGNIRVYFVNANHRLTETAWNNGYTPPWAPERALPLTADVAPNTSPSHIATPNGGVQTFYVATDRSLHVYSYEASEGERDRKLAGTDVEPGTSPSAHLTTEGNIRVYYVENNTHVLLQYARNNGTWITAPQTPVTGAVVRAGTSPSSIASPNGGVRTYYINRNDNAVHEISYDGVPGWADSGALSWPVAAGTSPSAILNLAGQPRVSFVAAADSKLHELIYDDNPGWSETAALTTGPVAAGSTPTLHVNSEGNLRTYYASLNGQTTELRQLVWNHGLSPEWADQGLLPTAVMPATNPVSFAWDNAGVRTYFVGSDSFLHELNATVPTPFVVSAALSGAIEPGSSPAAMRNGEGNIRVYVVAASDHKIHEVAWNAGHTPEWAPQTGALSSYEVAAGTSPSVVASPNGGVRLYYIAKNGTSRTLRQISYDGASGWNEFTTPTAAVAAGTSPSAHLNTEGNYRITYVGTNNKLRMFSINGGQFSNDVELPTSETVAANSSPVSVATRSGGYRAYFVAASDQGIREVSYDPADGWKSTDALTPPVATATNPSVARCRYTRVCVQYVANSDKKIYQTASDAGSGWLAQMTADFDAVPLLQAMTVKSPYTPEQSQFEAALRNRTQDGDMVYNVDTSNAFIYYQGVLHQVPQSTADSLGFSLTSGRRTTTGALAPYTIGTPVGPTDWQCGGLDHTVNTDSDRSCVVGKIDAAASDSAAITVLDHIGGWDNRQAVERALVSRLSDGNVAHKIDGGREYLNYASGQWRWVPDQPDKPVIDAVGFNRASAKRVTEYGVNTTGYSFGAEIGPYKTSWDYGGADRTVSTDAEARMLIGQLSANDGTNAQSLLDALSSQDNAWLKNTYLLSSLTGGPSPSGAQDPSSDATAPVDPSQATTSSSVGCQREQNFRIGMYNHHAGANHEPWVELRWDMKYCSATDGSIHHVMTIFEGNTISGGWKPLGQLQRGGGWEGSGHFAYRRVLAQQFELCGGSNAGVNVAGSGFTVGGDGCLTGTLTIDRTVFFGRLWHPNPSDSTVVGYEDASNPVGPCSGGSCRS